MTCITSAEDDGPQHDRQYLAGACQQDDKHKTQVFGTIESEVGVADLHIRAWVFPGHCVQEGGWEARGCLSLGLSHDGSQLWYSPNPIVVRGSQERHIRY